MRLVTGNDLVTGDVTWWTGREWSRHIAEAVDAGTDAEAIAQREEAALRVNVPYVVEAAPGPTGPVPFHIKDRIRRLDAKIGADGGAGCARRELRDMSARQYLPGTGRRTKRSLVEGFAELLLRCAYPSITPLRVAVPLPVPGRY